MQYEFLHYQDHKAFNDHASRLYRDVMNERASFHYDLWWKVEQIFLNEDRSVDVLWSRPAPLRKG